MNLELRPYQENLKNKTREAFRKYKRVIMLAPCGSGKTVTAASIMKDSVAKSKKVWFVVHRRELLLQAENTLERYGISKDNIKILDAIKGEVHDFIRLLPDFTGVKFSGTADYMWNNTDVGALEQGQLTITPTTKDEYVENCYDLVEDTVVFTTGIDEVIYLSATSSDANHTKVYNLSTDPADATITATSDTTSNATAVMGTGANTKQCTITGIAAGSAIITLKAEKTNYASFERSILVIVA